MDEENIYEDLDNFILEQQVGQVQENNKELLQTIEKLEETTKKFHEEISELKTINQNLERNISALFKTAKNEIERKDLKITELRRDLENLKFRRGLYKKVPKTEGSNPDLEKDVQRFRCEVGQKNRIIQSLTKELESVKRELSNQDKHLKRNASYFDDDNLRNRLGKKRKLDEKRGKTRRSRSRSRDPRFDNREKSRTIRRNRSGSFEQRRSIVEKNWNKYENSKSRSRSPVSHKIRNKNKKYNCRTNKSQYQENINKVRSRSRSSSFDPKKYHKHKKEKSDISTDCVDKNIKKVIHNSHLIKEDSGMSSSNSHTSELLLKCDKVQPNLKVEDLEEGEIDCSLEDVSDDKLMFVEKVWLNKENLDKKIQNKSELVNVVKPSEKEATINKTPELSANKIVMDKENQNSHDVLELTVQSNYLDDLDIDEEILKMRLLDDDKRKKRKEDKARICKLKSAISECKQNIQLLEHNFNNDEESETEDEPNKTGPGLEENIVNTEQSNLVLKISKGTIVKSSVEPKTVNVNKIDLKPKLPIQKTDPQLDANNEEEILETNKKEINNKDISELRDADNQIKITSLRRKEKCVKLKPETICTNNKNDDVKIDESKFEQNFANITNIEPVVSDGNNKKPVESKLNKVFDVENGKKENEAEITTDIREKGPERKAPLRARRRRAFICIT